jgi:hypothetical protein
MLRDIVVISVMVIILIVICIAAKRSSDYWSLF